MKQPISSSSGPNNITTRSKTGKPTPCCAKVGVKRGPWTPEEDEVLCRYIKKEGSAGRWRTLPKRAGLSRCGKSCRLRWMNYLRPCVKRGQIESDEEDLILRLHRLLGNRWSLIAGRIPGRTDNEIKNYWNTHLSKKLISQGIDPRTHKPLEPNNSPCNDKPSPSTPHNSQNPNPKFTSPPPSNDPILPNQFIEIYGYYHEGTDIEHYQGLDLQRPEGIQNDENGEDDNLNHCNDDAFSSFLNSLINEDVFSNNQNQMEQQQGQQLIMGNNGVPQESNSDALISLPQMNLAFGAGCDAPIMSAFNQNHDPKRFIDDQVEKQR